MGNIEEQPWSLSKEEIAEKEYKRRYRKLKIKKMRASVLKKQITHAYEIIENVRFDFLSDTMFRDYFTRIKRNLEGAMSDYLLSDAYWEKKIKEHRNMSVEEYSKQSDNVCQPI